MKKSLQHNPETIIGEVLGVRAQKGLDPLLTNYRCPFIHKTCSKRSTNLPKEPFPICSIWKRAAKDEEYAKNPSKDLICVCPKRFYAVDFLRDVISHCWPGEPPKNPLFAPEVKMEGFGNVDFVIADVNDNGTVKQFLSVELQAIDITGSVFPAYEAIRKSQNLEKRSTYGLNWDNVYKRYITQLIRKGYFHHHWKTKIVAVIQEQIYRNIVERADFMRTADIKNPNTNIIFMTYRFDDDKTKPGQFTPVLTTVEGTSHSSLQSAILYKEPPSREKFCSQIQRSLSRTIPSKSM